MSVMKTRVSKGLKDIGACYCISSDKFIDVNDSHDKATYHIHPDCSYPHQNNIKRFDSLKEIMNWINACKKAYKQSDYENGIYYTVIYVGNGEYEVAQA